MDPFFRHPVGYALRWIELRNMRESGKGKLRIMLLGLHVGIVAEVVLWCAGISGMGINERSLQSPSGIVLALVGFVAASLVIWRVRRSGSVIVARDAFDGSSRRSQRLGGFLVVSWLLLAMTVFIGLAVYLRLR